MGALGLGGYQLLADVGGVGAGRLGPQAFLLIAPDPDPSLPDAGTQIALHHTKLRNESDLPAFIALAAQLGYLRLSGYRLALERHGLRSRISVVNPATGGDRGHDPRQAPRRAASAAAAGAAGLLAAVRSLPPAGPPPDLESPELLRQVLLALALGDEDVSGAEAAELADRALELIRAHEARWIRRRRWRRPRASL